MVNKLDKFINLWYNSNKGKTNDILGTCQCGVEAAA